MTKEQVLLAFKALSIEYTKDDVGNLISMRSIQLSIGGRYYPPNKGAITFYLSANLVAYRDTFVSVAHSLDKVDGISLGTVE